MSAEISDRLARLKKLSDRLEIRALHCDDMMLPSVAAQFRLTLAEIDSLKSAGCLAAGGAPKNEIATRAANRKNRQSAAKTKRTA